MAQVIHFPKTVGIAIYSMVFISLFDARMNVDRIAEFTSSSKFHTAKILKELAKYGYLKSTRGPSGGFELNQLEEEISLLELWEVVEGKFEIKVCLSGNKGCLEIGCIFSDEIYNIQNNLYDYLRNTTILSLTKKAVLKKNHDCK